MYRLTISYPTLISNALVVLLITSIFFYFKWCYSYWKRKNIPSPKPILPFGNILDSKYSLPSMHEILKLIYDDMKGRGHKHCGLYVFSRPIYLLIDPEYIKVIMTRDFHHFTDRGIYHNEQDDPIGSHILVLEGQKWRRLRTKFTPTFTIGKMRLMFDSLADCARQMLQFVARTSSNPLDIKETCACFTTDVIGSCVFGINCNSFDEEGTEFRRYGRKLFDIPLSLVLRMIFCSTFPNLAKSLRMKIIDPESAKFFMGFIEETLKFREEKGIVRNDFLQLLMEMRQRDRDGLSINEIAAQAFLFFVAGFETSSTTMAFCIYELAHNPDVQEKARHEIHEVLAGNGGALSYDGVMEMKYLSRVVDETLRKHPSVPSVPRICTKDYKLPDGENYIEAGTQVFVPVFALHRDPEFYPDPEKFDPDRFTEENKSRRHPYTYLPFGEGPRICLGQRFGLLQVKIGLITLLNDYVFSPNPQTTYPLKYDRYSTFLTVKQPVWVNVEKIAR
ncbi:Cyp6a9 [Trypoxylus dichotomus]